MALSDETLVIVVVLVLFLLGVISILLLKNKNKQLKILQKKFEEKTKINKEKNRFQQSEIEQEFWSKLHQSRSKIDNDLMDLQNYLVLKTESKKEL